MDFITPRLGDIIPSSPSASSRSTASSFTTADAVKIKMQTHVDRDLEREKAKIDEKDECDTSHIDQSACICRPERHPLSATAINALERLLLARQPDVTSTR